MEPQILNTILQSLLDQIAYSYGNLLPVANYFFGAFAALTLVKLGLAYAFGRSTSLLEDLLAQIFKMAFMLWVINYLPYLHEVLRDGAIKLGIKAAGKTTTLDLMLNPSEIAAFGFKAIMPLQKWLHHMSWNMKTVIPQLSNMFFAGIAILFILGAFFYLALQMFMTLVDFYFTAVLAPVFLAFTVFKPAAWVGAGAIRGPMQHAVKLFTMAFIISLTVPWLDSLTGYSQLEGISQAGSLTLAALILVALALKAGSWSAGMFSGNPTASAGDLVSTAGGIAGTAVVGTYMSKASFERTQQVINYLNQGAVAASTAAYTGARIAGAANSDGSFVAKTAAMGYGAIKGAAGYAASVPKEVIQRRIIEQFEASRNRGTVEGAKAVDADLRGGGNSATTEAMKKAQMYERIAKAFKESQKHEH